MNLSLVAALLLLVWLLMPCFLGPMTLGRLWPAEAQPPAESQASASATLARIYRRPPPLPENK